MASKIMFRSCDSSVRTLISRHLCPTVAASNIQTKTLVNNIYNWQYILPDNFVLQPVNSCYGFGSDVAGYSVLEEVARSRHKFGAVKNIFDDDYIDNKASYFYSDDDDDDGSGDDDDLGTDDD